MRLFSQNGEDGILDALLHVLPNTPKTFLEFGVGDGWSCNTRLLAEIRMWSGTYIEVDPVDHQTLPQRYAHRGDIACIRNRVTADNVCSILDAAGVTNPIGVLSVDVDGQDYWIWKALAGQYRANVVVIEINSDHPIPWGVEAQSAENHGDLTRTWGSSIQAMAQLGRQLGHVPVHVDLAGVNMFLIREEVLETATCSPIGELNRGPNYGLRGKPHPVSVAYPSGMGPDRPCTVVGPDGHSPFGG